MINKTEIIEIDINPNQAEFLEDGRVIPYKSWCENLSSVIQRLKELDIPESEYKNIKISACTYRRSNDTYLLFEYHKSKSDKQIQEESMLLARELDDKRLKKLQKKEEREKRRQDKQRVLDSLSKEQKEVLGL